jgi:hypothetical protein
MMRCFHCDKPVSQEEYIKVLDLLLDYETGLQSDVGERFEALLTGDFKQETAHPSQVAVFRPDSVGDPVICLECLTVTIDVFEGYP